MCIAPVLIAALACGPAQSPESLGDVVTDWILDIDHRFENAARKHGRSGSGFFTDILELEGKDKPFVNIQLGEPTFDGYRPEAERIFAELQELPIFELQGWKQKGTSFYKTFLDGREHSVSVTTFWDDDHGVLQSPGLYITGDVLRPEPFGLSRDDVPPTPGEVVSLYWRLKSLEGKAAFGELLHSAKNDFEGQLEVDESGTLVLKESALNPSSPLPFFRVEERAERIDIFIDVAPLADDTAQQTVGCFSEFGYDAFFPEERWESLGGAGKMGLGDSRHVMWRREFLPGTDHAFRVLSSIKREYRELHARNQLTPSDLPDQVQAVLGCASGDCDNGFGELRFLNPRERGVVFAYRGRFKDGQFHGPGAVYRYASMTELMEDNGLFRFDDGRPEYFGHFEEGVEVTVHEPLRWFDERTLCKKLNRAIDCDRWRATLDQFGRQSDGFSVAFFATQTKDGPIEYSFLQHHTLERDDRLIINRPFTLDFGVPLQGTCVGGTGVLELPGIGELDATFDENGTALDDAYLTLLSGEIYSVRLVNGIPLDFERVAVPEGISWLDAARVGSWIMLQKNTCLEGDVRTDSFVQSVVREKDGSPRKNPGYLTRKPQPGSMAPQETFTLYYHTGIERVRAQVVENSTYQLTDQDGIYFDVEWNKKFLSRETVLQGGLDENLRLNGAYPYKLLGQDRVAYFQDDIRYKTEAHSELFGLVDDERRAERRRQQLEAESEAYEEIQRRAAQLRAAESAKREAAARAATRPRTHLFPGGPKIVRFNDQRPKTTSAPTQCNHCAGFGFVFQDEWRRVRRVKEDMLFITSYYENEKVSVQVTCPKCYGTGKSRR